MTTTVYRLSLSSYHHNGTSFYKRGGASTVEKISATEARVARVAENTGRAEQVVSHCAGLRRKDVAAVCQQPP